MKGIGGFYYVETAAGLFECKAKGIFRKERLTPLAGDLVAITVREDKDNIAAEKRVEAAARCQRGSLVSCGFRRKAVSAHPCHR